MGIPAFQSLLRLALRLTSLALVVTPAQAGEAIGQPLQGIQTEVRLVKKLVSTPPANKESQPTILSRVLEGQELLNTAWVWLFTVPLLPEDASQ